MKVLLGLSGGVDSSTAAALLRQEMQKGQGTPAPSPAISAGGALENTFPSEITGLEAAYIKTWMHEENPIGDCPWERDAADARAVCEVLQIPFRVINLISDYERHVAHYLIEGYKHGITPNPDIACNRYIKFGAFLQLGLAEGFTHVATGHYCRRRANPDGSFSLLEGADPNKDQSYFLAQISQEQLSHALFPVGELLKPQVRQIAAQYHLPTATKKDSQGICFLGKVKINDFLRHYLPDSPGPIVNHKGAVVGQHQGLHHHTIGQRHGFNIPSNTDFEHYVVVSKDFTTNTLYVAFDKPTSPGLYQQTMQLHHLHALGAPFQKMRQSGATVKLLARPRYRDPKVEATLSFTDVNTGTITFATPQRALASGQIVAFYNDNELIGSAVYL